MTCDYYDGPLMGELSFGMPIVGRVKASSFLTALHLAPSIFAEGWRNSIPRCIEMNLERAKRTRPTEEETRQRGERWSESRRGG